MRQGYKQTEVGVIPEDWDIVPLAQLFTFKNGLNKAKKFFGHGTPIINYMDVFSRSTIFADNLHGRVDVDPRELAAYEVNKGDVLFTRTSETIEEVGTASAVMDDTPQTVFSGFVLRASPISTQLAVEFKAYCFTPRYFREQVTARATYTTRALTNGKSLSACLLAVPNVPEQRAIAAALEDVDAAVAAVDRLITKKRDIKRATMQQLLTGRTRLAGFAGPWDVKRLGEVASLHKAQIVPSQSPETIFQHFSLPAFDALRQPQLEPGSGIGSNKFIVPEGAFLISKLNPRIPRVWVPEVIEQNAIASTEFLVLIPKEPERRRFLAVVAQSMAFCSKLENAVTGTTGSHQRVTPDEAMRLEIDWPADVEEQSAITSAVMDMDAELAALQVQLDKTRLIKQAMMQDLLTGRVRLPFQ